MTVHSNVIIRSLYKYIPLGECLESQGSLPTDKLFTGQRLDSTGLYYYGARYYDPTIGRFISPDPISHSEPLPNGQVIKGLTVYRTTSQFYTGDTRFPTYINPQEHNRYSYALNNPLRYADPDGHQTAAQQVLYDWYIWLNQATQSVPPQVGWILLIGTLAVGGGLALDQQTGWISSAWDAVGDAAKSAAGAIGGFFNNLNPFKKNQSNKEPGKNSDNNLPRKNININNKIQGQMEQRGWSEQSIQNAVDNPYTIRQSIDMRTGQPATAYYPEAGSPHYVVRNNVTGDIIQISNRYKPNWVPDPRIIDPYLP